MVVKAAAGVATARTAAQARRIAAAQRQVRDLHKDGAGDNDHPAQSLGVEDSGCAGVIEITVVATGKGQRIADENSLADLLAVHQAGLHATANARNLDDVILGRSVNRILNHPIKWPNLFPIAGVDHPGQTTGQLISAHVKALVAGPHFAVNV